jgi:hypothetical protein
VGLYPLPLKTRAVSTMSPVGPFPPRQLNCAEARLFHSCGAQRPILGTAMSAVDFSDAAQCERVLTGLLTGAFIAGAAMLAVSLLSNREKASPAKIEKAERCAISRSRRYLPSHPWLLR